MSSHKKSKVSEDEIEVYTNTNTNTNTDTNINNDNINDNTTFNYNNNPIDFSKLDLNQISSLLNNIDINQLSSLFGGLLGGMGGNGENSTFKFTNDKRVDILNAVKPLVPPQRATLIDVILQLYTIRKILKIKK